MGEFTHLPDGTMFLANGVGQGTAGYGWSPVWMCVYGSRGDLTVRSPNQQGLWLAGSYSG